MYILYPKIETIYIHTEKHPITGNIVMELHNGNLKFTLRRYIGKKLKNALKTMEDIGLICVTLILNTIYMYWIKKIW